MRQQSSSLTQTSGAPCGQGTATWHPQMGAHLASPPCARTCPCLHTPPLPTRSILATSLTRAACYLPAQPLTGAPLSVQVSVKGHYLLHGL